MFQSTTVVGYLGGDPEMRYMPDGNAVTNISVATTRKWKDSSGVQQEETTWFRISFWGSRAEVVNQYFTKGQPILVEGRLKPDPNTGGPRIWTDNNGNPRASFEMTANNFSFLPGQQGGQATSQPRPDETPEEEIPF